MFISVKRSAEIEVTDIKGDKLGILAREGAVEENLDKFERGGWSSNVTREADVVAANGDAISVGIFLIRVDLADNLGAGDIFAAVGWMSSYLMTNKVLVPLTSLPYPFRLVPMPWQILQRLLE